MCEYASGFAMDDDGYMINTKKKIIEKLKLERDMSLSKFADKSVKEIECSGVFEYIPGRDRGKFMDEVYRVLAPEGKATFTIPHWQSAHAFQDYRYEWPPLCEQSFLYFCKAWRDANKLDLGLKCNFDFTYGYAWEPATAARSDEARAFNTKHYVNCIDALQLVLTKAKPN